MNAFDSSRWFYVLNVFNFELVTGVVHVKQCNGVFGVDFESNIGYLVNYAKV